MSTDRGNGNRGRPPKFGRPAQIINLTIPNDVLHWLQAIHPDPGWAIVLLHERLAGKRRKTLPKMRQAALAQLTPQRSLIVVNPAVFRGVKGVSILPLARGRAFLALQTGQGIVDLEIAILDRLEDKNLSAPQREALTQIRAQIKEWRSSPRWRAKSEAIILIERRRTK
jgi:hypothetical protein